ncbi:unnamed protein product [Paramecium octaurelia]|uniref:Rab-GAP TBC domain-containing protein n=1 Tax=Paramecium octaurelia TaxID=43137 RepID=A0A8S1V790_PAROT|nr:unnamed protein product [Paramecium octaurelia]
MRSQSDNSKKMNSEIISKANFLYTRALMWPQLMDIDLKVSHPIQSVKLNQQNQRVIKFDVIRTRGNLLDQNLKTQLEQLLTYYVISNHICYKQGLHEIAAPFIIFIKAGLDISVVYSMFNEFIKRYMTNFFDDHYSGIQSILSVYNLLLKYHDMELYNRLTLHDISPQLYAIPWFITLGINKASFPIAQMIIENTILINDRYFIFSFNIAIVIYKKREILNNKGDNLPYFMSKIYLDDEKIYYEIIKIAIKIHTYTPKQFWIYLDSLNLFNHHAKPIFLEQEKQPLLELIQISPYEVQDMINQHILITEKWEIQDVNHPQVQKIKQIFSKQIYNPQQPVLIFDYLADELRDKIAQNTFVHIVDLSRQNLQKILQQLFNFKMTNKLWICLFTNTDNENLFNQIYLALQEANTKYICKCDKNQFIELYELQV